MLGFIGDYAHWCYTRDGLSPFNDIHDNLLFRFLFAPIVETIMFAGPVVVAMFALLLILGAILPAPSKKPEAR